MNDRRGFLLRQSAVLFLPPHLTVIQIHTHTHIHPSQQVTDLPAPINASQLGAAFGQAAALTTRAHQADWATVAASQGTRFKLLVLPEVSRHALIKLTDSKGHEVGQGVICLRHAFPTSLRSRTGAVQV